MYFAEFDHLPVVRDLGARLMERLDQEQADVLGHGLRRVDGTSNVHYLYHLSDPEFLTFWRRISVRPDKETVLHMLVDWIVLDAQGVHGRCRSKGRDFSVSGDISADTRAPLGISCKGLSGSNQMCFDSGDTGINCWESP